MKKLLVVVTSEKAHHRITSTLQPSQVNRHIHDLPELQRWLQDNPRPVAALVDAKWNDYTQAVTLLRRFDVPVTEFRWNFKSSDAWVKAHMGYLTEESDPEPSPSPQKEEQEEDSRPVEAIPAETVISNEVDEPHDVPTPDQTAQEKPLIGSSNPFRKRRATSGKTARVETTPSTRVEEIRPDPGVVPKSVDERAVVTESNVSVPEQPTERISQDGEDGSRPTWDMEDEPWLNEPRIGTARPIVRSTTTYDTAQSLPIELTLKPRLIVVTQLWPGAGATFVTMALADMLSRPLPFGNVTLIEHPSQKEYLGRYFHLPQRAPKYRHWLDDGKGDVIQVENVGLVPLPDRYTEPEDARDATLAYIFRELRRPFVLVDAGPANDDDILLESADDVVLVMDSDPSKHDSPEYERVMSRLLDKYPKLHLVVNKWTKHADMREKYPGAVFIPYGEPNLVQKAVWDGVFPSQEPKIHESLSELERQFISEWLPKRFMQKAPSKKSKFSFGRNRK